MCVRAIDLASLCTILRYHVGWVLTVWYILFWMSADGVIYFVLDECWRCGIFCFGWVLTVWHILFWMSAGGVVYFVLDECWRCSIFCFGWVLAVWYILFWMSADGVVYFVLDDCWRYGINCFGWVLTVWYILFFILFNINAKWRRSKYVLPFWNPRLFCGVRVARSLVFICILFCLSLFVLLSFGHCVVSLLIYGFWLPFGIFKLFLLTSHDTTV